MTLPRNATAGALTCWLVSCALLLAQTLGLLHGVVHPSQAPFHLHQDIHLHGGEQVPGSDWISGLFFTHDGDQDCRLFDQASHGSAAPPVAMLSLPAVLVAAVFDISRSEARARWAALFDARGPPLTR